MRSLIDQLPGSMIREVANAGMARSDVLAFWFGESDEATPQPVRDAAIASLMQGETFYSHNLGLPELRQALRDYTAALHGDPGEGRIAVTSAGVNGLMLAAQLLINPGDEVVVVSPVWPNLPAQPTILGGQVRRVALAPDASGAWHWRPTPAAPGGWICPRCWPASASTPACCWSMPPTTPPVGRSAGPSSKRCSIIAGAPAPGSWPMRCTSACGSAASPARRVVWMSPGRRTGSSSPTHASLSACCWVRSGCASSSARKSERRGRRPLRRAAIQT